MKPRHGLRGLLLVGAAVLSGAQPHAAALTPCSDWHEQYLPYNTQPLDIGPRVLVGFTVTTPPNLSGPAATTDRTM